MIANEIKNEIRNKLDIVSVVSKYVPLSLKGKNYVGVCPFHEDHSPSMYVSPEKQIFKCFVCQTTGNVFSFVSQYEHISYEESVKLLGIELGYKFNDTKTKINKEHDIDLEIYELTCKFYQNSLNTVSGKSAVEYLNNRNLDKDIIKKFRIGLSFSNISVTDFLLSKNYSLDRLVKLGISNENGKDLFVNRIMFPLYDLSGNVVAFSGRIYNIKDSSKYINTKETELFKKGNLLYNYHLSRESLKKNDSIIVMEGFMDVIRASTIGINNCVATMGTAFTKDHALLLKKAANNIILMFDGDNAGENATISAINVLREFDITPKVVRLPEGLDPDEYVLKYGEDKFKTFLDNPESSIDFMMRVHRNNKNLADAVDISKYINESLQELINVDDEILISVTLKKIEKEFNVDYQLLYDKLMSLKKNKVVPREIIKKENKKLNKYDNASRHLIFYMLKDEKVLTKVENEVIFFPDDNMRALTNELIYYYHKYGVLEVADFISYISDKENIVNVFNEIITLKIKEDYAIEEINDYISVINSYPVKKKENELNLKLKSETDPLKQASILSEKLALKGVK